MKKTNVFIGKLIIIAIFLLIVVFLKNKVIDYYFSSNYEMYPVAVFDVGKQRSLFVLTEVLPEAPVQSYYYRVRIGDRIVVQSHYIHYGSLWSKRPDLIHKRPNFVLVTAQNGNLVGLIEKSEPRVVLVVHDFTSGESWPKSDSSQQAKLLLKKLAESNPGTEYILGE